MEYEVEGARPRENVPACEKFLTNTSLSVLLHESVDSCHNFYMLLLCFFISVCYYHGNLCFHSFVDVCYLYSQIT